MKFRMPVRLPPWARGLLLLVTAWLGFCWWAAGELITPRRALPGPAPVLEGLVCEELLLTTNDGLVLAAWAITPAQPPGAVCVLLHAADNARSSLAASYAASRGLAVLALDLRGHGESTDAYTGFGWPERADVRVAVSEAQRRWPGLPLVGWGTSLGAAALVLAIDPGHDDSLPAQTFSALLLESLYADIGTAFVNRVDLAVGHWALPIAFPVRHFIAWRTDIEEAWLDPEAALARLTARVDIDLLLGTGSLDPLSRPDELERLAAASGGRAVLVQGAHHGDLIGWDDGTWLNEVRAFLDRWGKPAR